MTSPQEDKYFTLLVHAQSFLLHQQSNIIQQMNVYGGYCLLEIKMSDWAKIAYDWGKEAALMPISPKLYERIKELMRNSKYFTGTDDVIEELLNRYTKQELER